MPGTGEDADDVVRRTVESGANLVPRSSLSLRTIREMIRHEDALRDQRLGWLFALDGFLFATVGFAWDKPHTNGLVWALASVGIVTGVSALGSMGISNRAIRNLKREAGGRGRVMGIQRDDDGVFNDKLPWWVRLLYPWVGMPLTLVVIWPIVGWLHMRHLH